MPDECQKWSMEMIMFKSKPITLGYRDIQQTSL
jgi:hypothetical protein